MNMPTFAWQASNFLLAFWWGLLTTVGFFVVPLLFAYLDSTQAAGRMAAVLFRTQDYVNWICAGFLIIFYQLNRPSTQWNVAQAAIYLIAISVAASAVSHWLVAPQILSRENLKLWHGIGTALYLCQWASVTALLYLHGRKAKT